MIRSVNELRDIAMKAARGAGVPLGHCEEFAVAVSSIDAVELGAVAAVLDQNHVPVACTWDADVLQIRNARMIMAGPVICDAFGCGAKEVRLDAVDVRALLESYVLIAQNTHDVPLQLTFQNNDAVITRTDRSMVQRPAAPQDIPKEVWDAFDRFARKTYVPETEASRRAGAGAGLTDND